MGFKMDITEIKKYLRQKKLMLVGLCGRSGSGKGYTAEIFAELGIPSIDTDLVYRKITGPSEALSECMSALVKHFGGRIVADDNSLNRAEMRSLVFGEGKSQNLAVLNSITHAFILKKTLEEAEKTAEYGKKIILIDAPLLFESGFDKLCVKNICVTADEKTLLRRILRRDGISEDEAKRRLATQKPVSELEELCDYVIENNCEREELARRVGHCADELRRVYEENFSEIK